MTQLPPCPHCGDTENGVYAKAQLHGSAEVYYDENGEYSETSTDLMYYTGGDVLHCAKCYKIRRDVLVVDNQILPVKSTDADKRPSHTP